MSVFKFKEFNINQQDSSMKINTDGVLLGALAKNIEATKILDIGTGTGVIAMMVAQSHHNALVTAIEINEKSALIADENFRLSPFKHRLKVVNKSFQDYFKSEKNIVYDLILSNPPFFLNALKSHNQTKNVARHTDIQFFEDFFELNKLFISDNGVIQIIIPKEIEPLIDFIAIKNDFFVIKKIYVHSFEAQDYFRVIVSYSKKYRNIEEETFVIYKDKGLHSQQYIQTLSPYFINF